LDLYLAIFWKRFCLFFYEATLNLFFNSRVLVSQQEQKSDSSG
jgi:hypothetical protein